MSSQPSIDRFRRLARFCGIPGRHHSCASTSRPACVSPSKAQQQSNSTWKSSQSIGPSTTNCSPDHDGHGSGADATQS